MKSLAIKKTIEKQLNQLQQAYNAMQRTCSAEAIHDFRVHVKRLRAFLRMVNPGTKKHGSIPKKLKAVYQQAGLVRNWQLFMQTFSRNRSLKRYAMQHLDIALAKLGRSLKRNLVKKMRKKLLHRLPDKLGKNRIRTFRDNTLRDIDRLSHEPIPQADSLHAIRKDLKDLQYDKLLGHSPSEKKYYKKLSDSIGAIQDCKVEVQLLEEINHAHYSTRLRHLLNNKIQKKARLINEVKKELDRSTR